MGSFWGHLDEGLFFMLLAVWWIFHGCRDYIEAEWKGTEVKPRISYTVRCKKEVPLEAIFKMTFTLMGFMAEWLDGGSNFLDENGNFTKLVYAQHMTIYGIFFLHSLIDLLTWLGVPMVPGAAHFSAALSFIWYGVAFHYHAQMHGREAMDSVVHVLPISAMLVAGMAVLVESQWRSGIWTLLLRSFCLLTLGTWFSHVGFMLFQPWTFSGKYTSGWDETDMRNVQYARASFGLHLLLNTLFIIVCYTLTYVVMLLRHGKGRSVAKFSLLEQTTDDDHEELPVKKMTRGGDDTLSMEDDSFDS